MGAGAPGVDGRTDVYVGMEMSDTQVGGGIHGRDMLGLGLGRVRGQKSD